LHKTEKETTEIKEEKTIQVIWQTFNLTPISTLSSCLPTQPRSLPSF